MSLRALAWAFQQKLHAGDKIVLLALADMANADDEVWPSQAFLAEKCTLARETVNRALKRLEGEGLLVSLREGGNAREGLRYRLAVGANGDVAALDLTLYAFEVGGMVRLGLTQDAAGLLGQMRAASPGKVGVFLVRTGAAAQAKAALAAIRARFDNAREENGWHRIARADLLAAADALLPERHADVTPESADISGDDVSCDERSHETAAAQRFSCDGKSHGHVTGDHMATIDETSLKQNPPKPPFGGPGGQRPSPDRRDDGTNVADGEAAPSHPTPEPERVGDQFDRAWRAFEATLAQDRQAALREFGLLTAAEREQAVQAAGPYRRSCKAERRRGLDLDRWLREKRFTDLAAVKATGDPQRELGVFVWKDSDAWRAWLAHLGKRSMPVTTSGGREGWRFPSLWPPRRSADAVQPSEISA